MPPAIIAAGVVAAGTIGGAALSSHAQSSAAKTAAASQQQATDTQLQLGRENIAFQQGIYDQNKALLSPFVSRGNDAGGAINSLLGLGGSAQPQQQAPAQTQQAANTSGYQTASPYTTQPVNAMNAYDGSAADGPGSGDGARFHVRGEYGNDLGYQPNAYGMGALRNAAFNGGVQNAAAAPQAAAVPQTGTVPAPASSGQSASDAFNNFVNSAGMQFQLHQGENAINNGYAARGQIQSGAAMKALQNYGQSTALNNYFLPYMGLLQGQQAVGAQSGSAIAGVGSNFGNTVSNIYGQQGNAIQNGADATSNAALLRGQANANFGNSVGSALGTFGSSFFQPSSGGGFNSSAYLNTPASFSSGFGGTPYTPSAPNWGNF